MTAVVNDEVALVGIISGGIGCADSRYPGVNARVSAQKSWILGNSDARVCTG